MSIPNDWKEFLQLLNFRGVEYVIVGGLALAHHARPRFTGDLDILYRLSEENAGRVFLALKDFSLASLGISVADLVVEGRIFQFGVRPLRIDLMNRISGVEQEDIFPRRVIGEIGGVPVSFIDRESLIRNRRAVGREQDLADARALED